MNQKYKNETFMGWCVQPVTKTWRVLFESVGMSETAKKLAHYMSGDEVRAQEIEEYAGSRWFWVLAAKPFG